MKIEIELTPPAARAIAAVATVKSITPEAWAAGAIASHLHSETGALIEEMNDETKGLCIRFDSNPAEFFPCLRAGKGGR